MDDRKMEQQKANHKAEQGSPAEAGAVNVEIPHDDKLRAKKKWYMSWKDLWTTRQIAKKRGKEAEVKATIREFFIYISFLVTVHFVTFGAMDRSAYYYTEILSRLFLQTPFSVGNSTRIVTFDGVSTMLHFWGFLEKPMIESLYRSSIITTVKQEIAGKERKVLNENKVLGVPRLRQLSYVAIAYRLHKLFMVRGIMEKLIENATGYSNLEFVAFWEKQYNAVAAFLIFFVWIKLLKYINITHTTAQLNEALRRCAKDLAAFGLMFFIAICAYAQLGYSLFGTKVSDFRGIGISIMTLLRTIVGYNIYEEIQKADWFFAPIYYTAYLVFVFLILLNMFIAIIVNSYSEVKAEIAVMDDDLHITDFLKRHFKNVMEKFGVDKAYKSEAKDKEKKLTYNDIREILRQCKFTDLEIEMFFAKYEITGERIVTEADTEKMLRDMGWVDKEEKDVEIEEDSGVSLDEFEELRMRVENMEKFIDRLGKKINTVLERLELQKGGR